MPQTLMKKAPDLQPALRRRELRGAAGRDGEHKWRRLFLAILVVALLHLPLLLVIGGEKRGISRSVLSGTDLTVRIGYSRENRFRGSLSSAASAAVLGFEVMRQNRR